MIYENAQYCADNGVNTSIRVYISGILSFVPLDPANTDYKNMMELVAEGKLVIQPAQGSN